METTLKPSPIPDDGPYFDLEFDSSEESDFSTYRTSSSSDDFFFLLSDPPLPKPPAKFRLLIRTCFRKIKRVSKRCTDRLRFSAQLTPGGNKPPPAIPSGGKFTRQLSSSAPVESIRRRLRKCRSASAAVAAVTSPPPRPDEEDGIESAIAHCKRSFNSDEGADSGLVRCRSDPGAERINP